MSSLNQAIAANPEKFSSNLNPFLEVPICYQEQIIRSFIHSWKEHKEIQQTLILQYCKTLILVKDFWTADITVNDINRNQTIRSIADLIVEGTKEDAHAFLPENLPLIKEIVLFLIEKTSSDLQYKDDLMTANLNSAKGRVIAAIVNYALRFSRLNKSKDDQPRWEPEIEQEFTKRLDRVVEPSLEWSVSLGEYLPNLMYFDKEWVGKEIDSIIPTNNVDHWKAAMEGYLFLPQVYPQLYRLLKSHGHYEKAVNSDLKKDIRLRLIDHICIGLLRGDEDFEGQNSLFKLVIELWKPEDILECIQFFWMERKNLVENIKSEDKQRIEAYRKKILDFALMVYGKLNSKTLSDEEKLMLSRLSLLSCYLEKVDPKWDLPWLEFSAKYVKETDGWFFIEYLDKLANNSPGEAGTILINLVGHLESFSKEDEIRSIVSKLYKNGQKAVADKICNSYFMRGIEFLRELYEANNK